MDEGCSFSATSATVEVKMDVVVAIDSPRVFAGRGDFYKHLKDRTLNLGYWLRLCISRIHMFI
jgi:hypothetical protein